MAGTPEDQDRQASEQDQWPEQAAEDCTPNHFCNGRMVHLPGGEMCNKCGMTLAWPLPFNSEPIPTR